MTETQTGKWENETLSQIQFKVLRGFGCGATSCMYCFDDKRILSGSEDGTVTLWNSSNGKVLKTYNNHSENVSYCKISKDNTRLLSSSWDKTVCFIDVETGIELWRRKHEGLVTSCDISQDGTKVISASDLDNAITLFNAEDGTVIKYLKDFHKDTPTCCEFSPNCERFVSTGMDRIIKVYDIKSMKTTATLEGHFNIVSSARFSQNERYLATTSWDKSVCIWDISTGMYRSQGSKQLAKGHEGSVSCCKFSLDGQLLISGGFDSSVLIWDLENYAKKLSLKGHDDWVTGVDVSSDKKTLLSCSKDKTLRIWNIENMDQIPAVMENKLSLGLKMSQCGDCGKMFSIAQINDPSDIRACVFCRLAGPERNTLPSIL